MLGLPAALYLVSFGIIRVALTGTLSRHEHGAVTGTVWERPDSLFGLCERNPKPSVLRDSRSMDGRNSWLMVACLDYDPMARGCIITDQSYRECP